MEKAKHSPQPAYGLNLQRKRYFEFVVDLPLDECVDRLKARNEYKGWFRSVNSLEINIRAGNETAYLKMNRDVDEI